MAISNLLKTLNVQMKVSANKALKEEENERGGRFYVYFLSMFNVFQIAIFIHWLKR
jgi:hypothetical protein